MNYSNFVVEELASFYIREYVAAVSLCLSGKHCSESQSKGKGVNTSVAVNVM